MREIAGHSQHGRAAQPAKLTLSTTDDIMSTSESDSNHRTSFFDETIPEWPILTPEIRASVEAAMASGVWGKYESKLLDDVSEALSAMCGQEHVLLCCSGTFSVELALRGLNVQPGDEVVLAGYDFPGNFRAVEALGARPVLVDLEAGRWTMDLNQLEDGLGEKTKAVIVSHLHGDVQDLDAVQKAIGDRPIGLLEDNCQSPGGHRNGKPLGSQGNVATFSFGGSKLLSAGRGGAIASNDAQVIQRAKIYAHRGNDAFPFSCLQAAVLLPQFADLKDRTVKRMRAVAALTQSLRGTAVGELLHAPDPSADTVPGFYKRGWFWDRESTSGVGRDAFIGLAKRHGIPVDVGFRGFAGRSSRRCRKVSDLPNARIAAQKTVLLHHPVLLSDTAVIQALARAFANIELC